MAGGEGEQLLRDEMRRAWFAVGAVFAVHGAVTGGFATRIPWVRERLGLSAGALGLALLAPAIGAIGAMPAAGGLSHRFGGKAATRWSLVAWCAAGALPAFMPGLVALFVALLVYGAAAGVCDVAMNAQGVEVERGLHRPIMSGLHGMWSVGALAGAVVGMGAAHAGVDARVHLAVASSVLLLLGLAVSRGLLDVRAEPGARVPRRFVLPSRPVLLIAVVGFCAIFAEAAAHDWCAVYLRQVTGASAGVAAGSYTGFALAMAVCRLAGDAVVRRLGPVLTVRAGGLLAVMGGALVVLARTPAPGIAGFALIGLGVAVAVPLTFGAAGNAAATPSEGVAGAATLVYSGGLAAPAVIGGVADLTSLPVSFGVVTVMAAGMVVAAGTLRVSPPEAGAAPGAASAGTGAAGASVLGPVSGEP